LPNAKTSKLSEKNSSFLMAISGRPNAFIAFCSLIKFSSVLFTQISISPVDLLYPLIITAYPPTAYSGDIVPLIPVI